MKARVLAAGKGTRLLPITGVIPKPMAPVVGRVRLLVSANFQNVEKVPLTLVHLKFLRLLRLSTHVLGCNRYVILSKIAWRYCGLEIERKLRRVGGSVMVPIPPEMLDELQLRADQSVRLVSGGGGIRIEPAVPRPSPEVVEFAAKFMDEYEDVLRELADR
jgi:antitoxin component of MazEF toxin-antitoxin module